MSKDYSEYAGKKVIVTVNLEDGTASEVEGKVEVANQEAILIKPKGKTRIDIIEASTIEEIRLAPEPAKKLTAKKLKPVELGRVRQHLLDRHGYRLSEISAMAEEQAREFHEGLDHSDLGHVHVSPEAGETGDAPEVEAADEE